ncbi:hypothetical protein PoB_006638700 [Plakobranchus ocellatus]|uniref:Secreted protein n=1 Tax=Plakobranchus ocellatus TaxID=259542 RepID=A0AAV4D6W8_9GAST|nr:hypothetical protein PoB_006638700 [Plakobranchus ocellatus]
MWKLVALLASLLLVTEVAGYCGPLRHCDIYVGREFMDSLDENTDKSMVMSYLLGHDFDAFCPMVPQYAFCVDRRLTFCEVEEARDFYEARLNLLQYLCSATGKSQVTSLLNTRDCGYDGRVQYNLHQALNSCYEAFTPDMSNDCSHVETLRQCLVNSAPKSECHDQMVTFIEDVWSQATGKRYERLGCPTQ